MTELSLVLFLKIRPHEYAKVRSFKKNYEHRKRMYVKGRNLSDGVPFTCFLSLVGYGKFKFGAIVTLQRVKNPDIESMSQYDKQHVCFLFLYEKQI